MIELLALGFALVVFGPIALVLLGLVVLPLFLVVKVVGLAARVTLGLIGGLLGLAATAFVGLLLLPVFVVVGGLLLLKLMLLALPLLLLVGLIWLLVRLTARPSHTVPAA